MENGTNKPKKENVLPLSIHYGTMPARKLKTILLDRRYFALEPKDFDRFWAALDKVPTGNIRLRQTLASPPPWGR